MSVVIIWCLMPSYGPRLSHLCTVVAVQFSILRYEFHDFIKKKYSEHDYESSDF